MYYVCNVTDVIDKNRKVREQPNVNMTLNLFKQAEITNIKQSRLNKNINSVQKIC